MNTNLTVSFIHCKNVPQALMLRTGVQNYPHPPAAHVGHEHFQGLDIFLNYYSFW